jgi:hypothetical protein
MPYANLDPNRTKQLPSTEMPGWLDLLREFTQKQAPNWADYVGKMGGAQKDILDQDPSGAYAAYSNLTGYDKGTGYQGWLNSQQTKYRGQYETMAAGDPALMWVDFLNRINPEADYKLTTSPYDRGEYRSGYSLSPTMRMTW